MPRRFDRIMTLWLILVVPAMLPIPAVSADEGLRLEKAGTERVYFTHNGRPLLSFGGLSDFMFYAAPDAYDYKLWADWAAEHGINHVRAYPPLSWKYIEQFARDNGGSLDRVAFPYEETSPGNRQFDLTKFSRVYWTRFRKQCEYLESKGIIIHLLMWNGWQLRALDTSGRNRDTAGINWAAHFFNPANNVNRFTDHLGGDPKNRFRLYHSVADRKTGLVNAQLRWFNKLVETTADLDNVYYDLVHELAEHRGEWSKTQRWIDTMARGARKTYTRLEPGKPMILGMDTGGLKDAEREWIFTRPYFDLLVYGKSHKPENARRWRIRFKKPYIPQESYDDNGRKWSYIHPEQRVHARKYMWKFMMAKCQQLDLYMKARIGFSTKNLPKYPHNYDPNGRNKFEDDAVVLRSFWDSLVDYPNLWFNGKVKSGPGSHQFVLSSKKEAIVYCSSATGIENRAFKPSRLRLSGLSLKGGAYRADIISPVRGVIEPIEVVVADGKMEMKLPAFVDDIAVHVYPK